MINKGAITENRHIFFQILSWKWNLWSGIEDHNLKAFLIFNQDQVYLLDTIWSHSGLPYLSKIVLYMVELYIMHIILWLAPVVWCFSPKLQQPIVFVIIILMWELLCHTLSKVSLLFSWKENRKKSFSYLG